MKPKYYSFQADILKVISAVGVVLLHSFDSIYFRPDFFGGSYWWLTHLAMSLFRTAVPIFILLSGYLNIGKQRSFSQTWTKTKKRILIPLFSFFAAFIAFDLISGRVPWKGFETVVYFFNKFNINTQTLLYFLIILFFLYILTPFFNLLFKEKKTIQKKFIFSFILLGTIILITRLTTFRAEEHFYNTYNTWISYIGYYLLGYYIKKNQFTKKQYFYATALFIASYFTTVFGSYFTNLNRELLSKYFLVDNITYFLNYQSINVIILSTTLFILVIKSKQILKLQNNKKLLKLVKFLAKNSFGIFLTHQLVLYSLNLSFDNFFSKNILVFLTVVFISCFILSLLITQLIRKSPLKFVVGE